MANSDPPDEINDGEAPSHGDVYAPNSYADGEEDGYRIEEHQQQQEGSGESQKPSGPLSLTQNDGADLVCYRGDRIARLNYRRLANFGRALKRIGFHAEFLLER